MKSLKLTLLLFLVSILVLASPKNVDSLDSSLCKPYELVFARGSGQSLDDVDFQSIKAAIKTKIPEEDIVFYELGEKGNGYKAVSIEISTALGAYVSAGESYKFGESVETGIKELISHINSEIKRCKDKRFILAGYSQGALVVDKSLNSINANKIIYVGNFGDPKLYLPEGNRACKNIGLSSYRVYVPDCNVEEGVLGGLKPYQPAGYDDKLGVWCNKNDFMCGSSLNLLNIFGGHTSYSSKNGYEKFADIVYQKINKTPLKETTSRYSDASMRDIIVVFDHYQFYDAVARRDQKTIEDDLKELLIKLADHGTRIAIYNSYGLISPVKYFEEKISFTSDNLAEKIDRLNRENVLTSSWVYSSRFNNNFYAVKKLSESADWLPGSERNIFLLSNITHDTNISFDGTTVNDAIKAAKNNNVKVSILSNTGVRYLEEYYSLLFKTGGDMIARDYSKIMLNQQSGKKKAKYTEKTFNINQKSSQTLVIINDMFYGFSSKDAITVTNLNCNLENTIKFISYNSVGKIIGRKTFIMKPEKIRAPESGAAN